MVWYLVLSVFLNASSSIFGKIFNRRNDDKRDSTKFYNLLQILSVFIGWCVLFIVDFSFDVAVLPYALLFATCYSACNIGVINALKHGPAMLTSLFTSLSLILTTIWGFFFWGSEVTPIVVIGLVLVVVSIYLCLYQGKEQDKISWKWLIYVLMAFLGNAGCSIVQRTQQIKFNGEHGNMLMVFASFVSVIILGIIYLVGDKRDSVEMLKKSWYNPVMSGLCNVALNLFVIIMATSTLSPSLIYPTLGVGGLAVVLLFSLFMFKEKLKWWQWIGILLGAVATVLLSI